MSGRKDRTESLILMLIILLTLISSLSYIFIYSEGLDSELNAQLPSLDIKSLEPGKPVKLSDFTTTQEMNFKPLAEMLTPDNQREGLKEEDLNSTNPNLLFKYKEVQNKSVVCVPRSYRYTSAQLLSLFTKKHFSDCKEVYKVNPIKEVKNNKAYIECDSKMSQYLLGASPSTEKLGRVEYPADWTSFYSKVEIDLKDREFFMVKCSYSVKQAYIRNIFNPKASERAEFIARSKTEAQKTQSYTPLGVYVIMLDSVSRAHFYRNLLGTVKYLNEKIDSSSDFVVYDFLNNNANSGNTRPNLVPMLLGKNFEEHDQLIREIKNDKDINEEPYKAIQNTSVWKHYERMGFVTSFVFDTIWNYFCDDVGRKVHTDHQVFNFWNAAKRVFSYSDFMTRTRCFGDQHAHWFALEYQNQFFRNYKGVNRFAYTHLSISHENTGTVIKTLDEDLKNKLEELFSTFEKAREDLIVVLASDHGRKIQEWDMFDEGIYENRHPFHLIITKRSLINRIGEDTHSILTHNTERLISRYDWYVTLLHLANVPYGNLLVSSDAYKSYIESVPYPAAVSVFLERVPDNRVCSDVGINEVFCLCSDYKEISLSSGIVREELRDLALTLIRSLNFNKLNPKCKTITLKDILHAYELVLKSEDDGGNRHFRVVLSVEEDESARFEIIYYAAKTTEFKRLKLNFNDNPSIMLSGDYMKDYKVQIESYRRIDENSCPGSTTYSKLMCVC